MSMGRRKMVGCMLVGFWSSRFDVEEVGCNSMKIGFGMVLDAL